MTAMNNSMSPPSPTPSYLDGKYMIVHVIGNVNHDSGRKS